MAIAAGTRFNHYEILSPLGAGGMGEVYLAEDSRLHRKVALKLLPEEFTRQAERVRRFEQEARAASALNHPNILTIFEIGETNGAHFIATEFVDGQTLRERLKSGGLPVAAALELGVQIVSAISAAHEAGIIHRDIKPENVMLRRDGIVKVLDFGIAKLTEQRPDVVDNEAPTLAKVTTEPGTVMGTASYMSPEQARGQRVDARSDIFSLGVMLYEMVAGRPPFDGVNALDVIGAILNRAPAPLTLQTSDAVEASGEGAPAELQRIITKALRKEREERYQVIKDLLLDLKSLKQELEFEAKLKGIKAHELSPAGDTSAKKAEAATNEVAVRTTSSAEYLVNQINRHRTGALITLCSTLVILAGIGYGLYRFAEQKPPVARFEKLKFTRLTTSGKVNFAAISPDGKYVAYVNDEGEKQGLWLKQVASAQSVEITPPAAARFHNLAFSPDSNFVYYTSVDADDHANLYQVAALGGASRKLPLSDVSSPVSFSPDGRRMVFTRRTSAPSEMELIVANADGTNAQRLATRKAPESLNAPAWSPDGKVIACNLRKGNEQLLVTIAVESGRETTINKQQVESFGRLGWLPDGSALVGTGAAKTGRSQVWLIAYPTGEARQLTTDLTGYGGGSLTADGRALVALHSDHHANIWLAPGGKPDEARQITSGMSKNDGKFGLTWLANDHLVYTSELEDRVGLWAMDASGGNQKQLTSVGFYPTAPPDGRYVVFNTIGAVARLRRMDADGGDIRQLTTGFLSSCSPDGKWIVYTDPGGEGQADRLRKIGIDGGSPTRLTDFRAMWPSISPDGKQIACLYSDKGSEAPPTNFGLIPFDGGPVTNIAEMPLSARGVNQMLRWLPDARAIAYLGQQAGVINIWSVPVGGGQPKQLTRFTSDGVYAFAWSHDGKWLAMSRGGQTTDAVLISEVKTQNNQ